MRVNLFAVLARFALFVLVLALMASFSGRATAATPEELAWSWSVSVNAENTTAANYPAASAADEFVQVCEGGKCKLVRVAGGSAKTSEPGAFATSEPTTVNGARLFQPFRRLKGWNESRPRLLGGFRSRFGGGCSSCGG